MRMKVLSAVAILTCIGLSFPGCGVGVSGPSSTVRKFYQYMDAQQPDKVISLFSRAITDNASKDKLKVGIAVPMEMIKISGGIRSIKFVKEEITGDTAEVTVTITLGNGETSTDTTKLVREAGVWKLAPSK